MSDQTGHDNPNQAFAEYAAAIGSQSDPSAWQVATDLAQIISALAVPLIALAAWWIARRQQQINELRLRHELYDRRFAVYERARTGLSKIMQDSSNVEEAMLIIHQANLDATFLFGPEVADFLDKVYRTMLELMSNRGILESPGSEEERKSAVKAKYDAIRELSDDLVKLRDIMKPYLHLPE